VAKEATFGTPVAPSEGLPFTGNALNTEPGLFYPALMAGTRDIQLYNLYGQRKHVGAIDAPIFANNGALFLVAAIGSDGAPMNGVEGTVDPSNAIDVAVAVDQTAGHNTITVTTPAPGAQVGQFVQIGDNSPSGYTGPSPSTSEVRLITSISTDQLTYTLDINLLYDHGAGASVKSVIAPFAHHLTPQVYLPSITVEKNLGGPSSLGGASLGGQSLQYVGCRVGKLDIKAAATDTEAAFTADMTAQWVQMLDPPSSVSFKDESPFAFSTFTFKYKGSEYKSATNCNITIDNGIKPTYTFNGSQDLQFLPTVALHCSGTFDAVYDTLDDATYGFWADLYQEDENMLSFTCTNAQGEGLNIYFPNVNLKTAPIDPKVTDVITGNVAFEARHSLSLQPSSMWATLTNGVHVSY
jgi:Phage tail tube protein